MTESMKTLPPPAKTDIPFGNLRGGFTVDMGGLGSSTLRKPTRRFRVRSWRRNGMR